MSKLEMLHDLIAAHCIKIEEMFKPGAKVTVIVRNPSGDKEAHSASVWVTNDDPILIIEAIEYLALKGVTIP